MAFEMTNPLSRTKNPIVNFVDATVSSSNIFGFCSFEPCCGRDTREVAWTLRYGGVR